MRRRPQAIQSKRDSRLIKAFDSQRNTLQVGDLVKVIDGPYVVIKMDNNFIFTACQVNCFRVERKMQKMINRDKLNTFFGHLFGFTLASTSSTVEFLYLVLKTFF